MNGRANIGWIVIMPLINFCLASNTTEPGSSYSQEREVGDTQAQGTGNTQETGPSDTQARSIYVTQERGAWRVDQDRQGAEKRTTHLCPGDYFAMRSKSHKQCNTKCASSKQVFWHPEEGYICFNRHAPARVSKEIIINDGLRLCQCGIGSQYGYSRSCLNKPHDIIVKKHGDRGCGKQICQNVTVFVYKDGHFFDLAWCHESRNLDAFHFVPTEGFMSGERHGNFKLRHKCWCGVPNDVHMEASNVTPRSDKIIYLQAPTNSSSLHSLIEASRMNPY